MLLATLLLLSKQGLQASVLEQGVFRLESIEIADGRENPFAGKGSPMGKEIHLTVNVPAGRNYPSAEIIGLPTKERCGLQIFPGQGRMSLWIPTDYPVGLASLKVRVKSDQFPEESPSVWELTGLPRQEPPARPVNTSAPLRSPVITAIPTVSQNSVFLRMNISGMRDRSGWFLRTVVSPPFAMIDAISPRQTEMETEVSESNSAHFTDYLYTSLIDRVQVQGELIHYVTVSETVYLEDFESAPTGVRSPFGFELWRLQGEIPFGTKLGVKGPPHEPVLRVPGRER